MFIKLFLRDGGTGLHYRFNGRSGREYIFVREPETNLKVLRIPLADWRANNFLMARDLLEQQLAHTIFPDFEIDADTALAEKDAQIAELTLRLTNAEAALATITAGEEEPEPADPTPTEVLTDEQLAERLGDETPVETPEVHLPATVPSTVEPLPAEPPPAVDDLGLSTETIPGGAAREVVVSEPDPTPAKRSLKPKKAAPSPDA